MGEHDHNNTQNDLLHFITLSPLWFSLKPMACHHPALLHCGYRCNSTYSIDIYGTPYSYTIFQSSSPPRAAYLGVYVHRCHCPLCLSQCLSFSPIQPDALIKPRLSPLSACCTDTKEIKDVTKLVLSGRARHCKESRPYTPSQLLLMQSFVLSRHPALMYIYIYICTTQRKETKRYPEYKQITRLEDSQRAMEFFKPLSQRLCVDTLGDDLCWRTPLLMSSPERREARYGT